ncbi:ABC transporter permease [Mameliella sediminis]|uniref:ABC transporter permease n=1 Tax=Mameliella sediminis TaxID=2836866 RepID=UPI001C44A8DB|nr:ABC transporter permease [Mameliella sediminis]MBY6144745.1 ABC transporter permease [Mameliella alba]MBV7395859.1 ABC transporter permease [Mameliella sediminis]MBY6160272.1 ABC transporter permease [Mameliella alba]MBY6168742.1 ABC transporter permease [Mameliella alba]MBY6174037.1 ABC transporter permease [Mameliella alba]
MGGFILRRVLYMIPTVFLVSIVTFIIIQLPPGDYLDSLAAEMGEAGVDNTAVVEQLREQYGLGQPMYLQYWKWMTGILFEGDFGISFEKNVPVTDVIWDRLGWTFAISILTLVFIWIVALPIGIYSAVRKYSVGDYIATFFGFVGLAVPNFLLALVMMYVAFKYFGQSVGGLVSPEYLDQPWSWAKFGNLLQHIWMPVFVVGTSGAAALIRIMRANLLDELYRPYVVTARAKGMSEFQLLLRYPVRVALNPFISTIGWILPTLVSGEIIVAVVMNLPTTGPLLLRALLVQDMYLAGSLILIVSLLTVIGTLLSDVLLAWVDPRIRYQ